MQLLIVSFFWFIVYNSEALKCKSCLERYSDRCLSEYIVDCDDSEGCGAVSGSFQIGSERRNFIFKDCRFPLKCNSWLRISMNGTYLQSYITCCDGELCNLDYYIPSDDNQPYNGKECNSCYVENFADICISSQKQRCRGDETLCVRFRGFFIKHDGKEYPVFFEGCANTLANKNFRYFYGFYEITFESYDFK